MIQRDTPDSYPRIFCDAPDCGTEAPSADEIMKGHGLNNMGWACWGGTHLCPTHADTDEVRAQEAARLSNRPALGSRHDG